MFKKIIITLICATLLSACGFHLRNSADIPSGLQVLYLNTTDPYSPFTTELKNLLTSMHIQLVQSPEEAPVQLHILHTAYTHDNPAISTTSIAVTYNYTLTAGVELQDCQEEIIAGPQIFSANNPVILNANQILTPGVDGLTKQELQHQVITLIYYWLTSQEVKTALCREKSCKLP